MVHPSFLWGASSGIPRIVGISVFWWLNTILLGFTVGDHKTAFPANYNSQARKKIRYVIKLTL